MYGMLTRIVVKPGKRSELLEYLRWDAEVAKAPAGVGRELAGHRGHARCGGDDGGALQAG